ncbi:MAG: hypothetical protein PWR20_1152 [Bacteroidales bacterium]|jgi:predicted Fe-Mo cluster-binding NifX family protein|nr:hypothetical protein [Bacteroidales bacterium]MDN5330155.1 hypothetical protein [Bacteroidales bacterium]
MKQKIAIPLEGDVLSGHFGHCEAFAFVDVEDGKIVGTKVVPAPVHEHGGHPRFLAANHVTDVIAGGMGGHAVNMLESAGIKVLLGAPVKNYYALAQDYLAGQLVSTDQSCHHHEGHGHHHHEDHDHHHHSGHGPHHHGEH